MRNVLRSYHSLSCQPKILIHDVLLPHAKSFSCLQIDLSKISSHWRENKVIHLIRKIMISQNMSFKMKTWFYTFILNIPMLHRGHISAFFILRQLEEKKIHHIPHVKVY